MKEGTIQHKIQEIKYMTDNRHAGGCSHHSVSTKEHLKKKIKLYKTHFQTKSELMFYWKALICARHATLRPTKCTRQAMAVALCNRAQTPRAEILDTFLLYAP
jgi:hypothetical protein